MDLTKIEVSKCSNNVMSATVGKISSMHTNSEDLNERYKINSSNNGNNYSNSVIEEPLGTWRGKKKDL